MAGAIAADDWQTRAWEYFDCIGELRYYVAWLASSVSRVRLVASDIDPDTGKPTGSTDDAFFNAVVRAIAGGPQGQSQYLKRAAQALTVPGEYWSAIIWTADRGERWLVVNKEELRRNGRGVEVVLPEGDRHELNMPTDSLWRVWNPHPRRATEPYSPIRSNLDVLAEIDRTTKKIRNADNSRLIGNGIVLMPHEMSLPPVQIPGQSPATGMVPVVQQLQELMWTVANTAHDDDESMAALIPIFITAAADVIGKVQHLKFDNSVTDLAIKTRNDGIQRLALGLDVNPERLLGVGDNSNHWSAWQLADEDVQLHIAPVMETLCQSIYEAVVSVVLERAGIDPSTKMLWYDTSELTADPDNSDNAIAAHAAAAITSEALIGYLGLDPDAAHDLSSADGWQALAIDIVKAHPEQLVTWAPLLPEPVATIIADANAFPALDQTATDAIPPEQLPPGQGPPATENQPIPDQPAPAASHRRLMIPRNGREVVH